MDELVFQLQESKVDPAALGEHPRFSQFKNASKAAEQQASRRKEWLSRQQTRRHDHFNHLRKLAENEADSSDEEEMKEGEEKGEERKTEQGDGPMNLTVTRPKLRYADQLMLSEWLVDIPSELSSEWIMVPAPVGRRTLVVCSKGLTTAYTKSGNILHQFKSHLPNKGHKFTILDCILSGNIFFCIDVLAWAGQVLSDNPFDLRRFILNSRLQEDMNLQTVTAKCKFTFFELPQCVCSREEMSRLMKSNFEFDNLDGLLFYHSQVQYEKGQSPMVGWLKPWMMTEILQVDVPAMYHKDNADQKTSAQFIEEFNKKHNHSSKIDSAVDMAVEPSV